MREGQPNADAERRREKETFAHIYTLSNLWRVRWVLGGLFLYFLFVFLFANRFSLWFSAFPNRNQLLLLVVSIGVMWAAVEWALGERASPRAKQGVALAYYVFGCLLSVYVFWQKHDNPFYWLSLIGFGTILTLPPRLSFPLLIGQHTLFIIALFVVHGDQANARNEAIFATGFVIVAGYMSLFFYNARWQDFLKEQTIVRQVRELNNLMEITTHNLGSPLHGLTHLLDIIRSQPDLGPEQTERMLDAARNCCSGMTELVDRLMEVHLIEHFGEEAKPQAADLVPHFLAAAERARPLAEAKGTSLALELPANLPGLAEPRMLGSILDNLLSNAVKYAPHGTRVTLALSDEHGLCRGEIRDEGPGIPDEERPFLFRKFHRGSNRPSGGEASTGLGLFIVRQLAEEMGSRVGHLPREPRGSVFWIELPGMVE